MQDRPEDECTLARPPGSRSAPAASPSSPGQRHTCPGRPRGWGPCSSGQRQRALPLHFCPRGRETPAPLLASREAHGAEPGATCSVPGTGLRSSLEADSSACRKGSFRVGGAGSEAPLSDVRTSGLSSFGTRAQLSSRLQAQGTCPLRQVFRPLGTSPAQQVAPGEKGLPFVPSSLILSARRARSTRHRGLDSGQPLGWAGRRETLPLKLLGFWGASQAPSPRHVLSRSGNKPREVAPSMRGRPLCEP